jgi:uncharacterized pyridoxal phosphate-containing UPF0001 family protein
MSSSRREEIAANLAAVRMRIAAAAVHAGRHAAEITLVAVTKTYPASDVLHLAALGVTDVGENRDQEAAPKAAEVRTALGRGVSLRAPQDGAQAGPALGRGVSLRAPQDGAQAGPALGRGVSLRAPQDGAQAGAAGALSAEDLRWHFIGRLQRNKCRSVVGYADVVQSVDSVRLAVALAAAADDAGRERPLDVLVQISVDGAVGRGGALAAGDDPDVGLLRVAEAVASARGLRLAGVMAVAPLDWTPAAAFEEVARCAALVRAAYPDATVISAGMSEDLEQAVTCGATHVRIGSALLGKRQQLR